VYRTTAATLLFDVRNSSGVSLLHRASSCRARFGLVPRRRCRRRSHPTPCGVAGGCGGGEGDLAAASPGRPPDGPAQRTGEPPLRRWEVGGGRGPRSTVWSAAPTARRRRLREIRQPRSAARPSSPRGARSWRGAEGRWGHDTRVLRIARIHGAPWCVGGAGSRREAQESHDRTESARARSRHGLPDGSRPRGRAARERRERRGGRSVR
jgi:hypothetical protein